MGVVKTVKKWKKEAPINAMRGFWIGAGFLLLFLLLWIGLNIIDVQAIGPLDSKVGFASFNGWWRDMIGNNVGWYMVSNLLEGLAIIIGLAPMFYGVYQWWWKRKDWKKVDGDLLTLFFTYVAMVVSYFFFYVFVVNYRPILEDGKLESSFPSSHTLLSVVILATAIVRIWQLVKDKTLRWVLSIFAGILLAVLIAARILAGVHWVTDIIGGMLLGGALVGFYCFACWWVPKKLRTKG